MEKAKEHSRENPNPVKSEKSLGSNNINNNNKNTSHVWDCGSSLYDSFELNSFKRQLDSAIACRTMSMPHLSDRSRGRPPLLPPRPPPPPPPPAAPTTTVAAVNKKSSKLSRSLNKLLRSVFKSKNPVFRVKEQSEDGFFVVYDKSGALTTIPEVPEIDFGGLSPEIGSLVRRTGSERFTAASIGISCA
ncbi:hypothetical protein FEM48_Zijuj11G0017900 [Ziziphus jujuba var. spinosa]|uniref:Uncharacterized protein n=1 Tax=Ziziphus jujuba var. spinosa TaxID=714518 RepID=A0A978UG44_ZIZJJ|nr:probable inactive serine/threonine-protein kinase slob1 [Ziziphus jujuba var. spinosa]KAH7513775.1 hypothetical protein FEM48_Zijuj11G0017900 [Ziziphus jujuba var. spinosa]